MVLPIKMMSGVVVTSAGKVEGKTMGQTDEIRLVFD